MKILIGYDGSVCSESALDDLARAGLPEAGEFLVMSIAEVWLPSENFAPETNEQTSPYVEEITRKHWEKNKKAVAEVETLANHAAGRLRKMFPAWTVSAEGTYGSPAWEILTKAVEWKPDLIVAGSHGRGSVGRFFLGSISQKLVTEAHCSVRVARGRIEVDPTPTRVVIGFDGSQGAQAAVEAVTRRNWRKGSEFRLITAIEQVAPAAIERFVPPIADWVEDEIRAERKLAEKLAEGALKTLCRAGFCAALIVQAGNPKTVLIEEAEKWGADVIFVGANRYGSRIGRFLLGSTSAAAAARAHCSVEVIRKQS